MKSGQLENKVAVVLGASAAAGSGWAIAEALAGEGAKVVVAARREAPLQVLADSIGGKAVVCDAGSEEQIRDLIRETVAAYGPIDIAVNAALQTGHGKISRADTAAMQSTMDVNYFGNVYFIKYAAAEMNDGGSIILISSSSSVQPVLPYFPYACSKAALDCLVRYAALEYGPRGIRVNSILPAAIKTEASKRLFDIPGVEEIYAREYPLGRIGLPRDYANAVLWLAGPAFITGANLPVSGGSQLTRQPRTDELSTASGDSN